MTLSVFPGWFFLYRIPVTRCSGERLGAVARPIRQGSFFLFPWDNKCRWVNGSTWGERSEGSNCKAQSWSWKCPLSKSTGPSSHWWCIGRALASPIPQVTFNHYSEQSQWRSLQGPDTLWVRPVRGHSLFTEGELYSSCLQTYAASEHSEHWQGQKKQPPKKKRETQRDISRGV